MWSKFVINIFFFFLCKLIQNCTYIKLFNVSTILKTWIDAVEDCWGPYGHTLNQFDRLHVCKVKRPRFGVFYSKSQAKRDNHCLVTVHFSITPQSRRREIACFASVSVGHNATLMNCSAERELKSNQNQRRWHPMAEYVYNFHTDCHFTFSPFNQAGYHGLFRGFQFCITNVLHRNDNIDLLLL